MGRPLYSGTELHDAISTAFGLPPENRRAVHGELVDALRDVGATACTLRQYNAMTRARGLPGAMDIVIVWCQAAGVDVVVRYVDPVATFIARIPFGADGQEYTQLG